MRLKRTPYVKPILDKIQEQDADTVVLCWAAQSGKSETALSVVGYYSHMEPCPIMWVLADEDTASYMNRERVQKMFKNTRGLKELVESDHYNLTKDAASLVNGAYVAMAWASSVAKLASRPIRVIIFDEVDKPGY